MAKLTAVAIKKAGDGKLFDGNGLELRKKDVTGRWVWRYSLAGKRREMGLGSYPAVGLADARRERDRWALVLAQSLDPITARDAAREAALADTTREDPRLEDLAQQVLDARKAGLRREGKSARWLSPLQVHVFPKIGKKPVSTIHQTDVRAALAPIWHTKHPTAERAAQRLMIIFREGQLMGYDCDPFTINAARHMLGRVLHEPEPIAATPWQEIPELYQRLSNVGSWASCLQFMILTVVRASGCRGARFDEIEDGIWTVPASRMKGQVGKVADFRVPLSDAALELVERRRMVDGEYLFTGPQGRPVSDAGLSRQMSNMKEIGRPHGFRTSFRSWVQDTDACGYDVAETVLAHKVGGRVERSYARSDLLERRRIVMDSWARFVTGEAENVVRIEGR